MKSVTVKSEADSTIEKEVVRGRITTKTDKLKMISIEMEDGTRYDIEHNPFEGGLKISKIADVGNSQFSIMPCVSNVIAIK